MPRIVPLQLLKCLKVLLDDNGGILSAGEVKRIASLMTKYSKKLVSKCIYVQILKCTKTELLGEFMGAGGWSLVYTWLNDGIRAMNWPLVQEILELLLLCPVDVHRLKINSAPKLVKGLCKDGGNEGVRILAKRLVEQWLKVVTENPEATLPPATVPAQGQSLVTVPQVAATVKAPAPVATTAIPGQQQTTAEAATVITGKAPPAAEMTVTNETTVEQDPLADVGDVPQEPSNYTLTPAQKKANEAGLVYKIVVKDGQQVLAKVAKSSSSSGSMTATQKDVEEEEEEENVVDDEVDSAEADEEEDEVVLTGDDSQATANNGGIVNEDENSRKEEKESESSGSEEDTTTSSKTKSGTEESKQSNDKQSSTEVDKDKSLLESEMDRKSNRDSKDGGKERDSSDRKSGSDKEKERKSNASSSHKSSHKSSSSSSKNSSSSASSSGRSKSSSSSSSHRSSSDKHRSSSSSNKDKDRKEGGSGGSSSSSSSSSKHRSSSSKSPSSSASSRDKHRDKDKEKTSSSSSSSSKNKDKERDKDACLTSSVEKDKDPLGKMTTSSSSLEKLGKIPKKSKDGTGTGTGTVDDDGSVKKPTSITIPSKKASMSIEIRRDSEKAKTVKTYKSQFRSHGLTEEAPPPPSRKGLKKPSSSTSSPGTVIPTSLPSSLKRSSSSPSARDSPTEKKAKIDINNVSIAATEKPGSIKLIAPKKIQTLIETNLFSDALSAATGPKKANKRKRPQVTAGGNKEGPSPPTSPEVPKVVPLKFYQDTLDESKGADEAKSNKENDDAAAAASKETEDGSLADKENAAEDDDDIPLKKVKEDIEQKVAKEKRSLAAAAAAEGGSGALLDMADSDAEEDRDRRNDGSADDETVDETEPKKPGPGCGPNGPPGVLMLHRRRGPKKKLSWRPQEHLEQIRYFELDENERVNVTKTSFVDMKNLERFKERDAINIARRGFNHEDNMEPQTTWRPLIEVDDVPPHPDGNQSKQRKIQADREMTTLRALYFSHALIPDSPAEAEIEPHFAHDIPVIPLDDITGNPDAVNDFTSMPWPEPKGSPKHGDSSMAGTGGLGSPTDMFGGAVTQVGGHNGGAANAFNPFINAFGNPGSGSTVSGPQQQHQLQLPSVPQALWQGPQHNGLAPMVGGGGGGGAGAGHLMNIPFNGHGSPSVDIGGPGMVPPGPLGGGGPSQNFMGQFGPSNNGPFVGPGSQFGPPAFNGPPNNFGPMGGPMGPGPMMNGMGPGPMMGGPNSGTRGGNNRNNGGSWRSGGSNFQDNNVGGGGGGGGIGNWRSAGSGPNRGHGGGGNNNGVCKAFMRGHCRLGKSCKYIHPKSKRI